MGHLEVEEEDADEGDEAQTVQVWEVRRMGRGERVGRHGSRRGRREIDRDEERGATMTGIGKSDQMVVEGWKDPQEIPMSEVTVICAKAFE